jgi:hypothetical protein
MCKLDLNLFIQLLTAIGTIAVAVIAIWGDWIKIKLTPPKLKIIALNIKGELTNFTSNKSRVIYYHLKVINSRPWSNARNCKVLLRAISKELPSGQFQNQPLNTNPSFIWTPAEITPQTINLSKEHAFDFGYLEENCQEFRLALNVIPNNFEGFVRKNQKIRYSLQPYADNYISEKYQVFEVAWNGYWSDNMSTMAKNLTIREIIENQISQ